MTGMCSLASIANSLKNVVAVELLPYHPLGRQLVNSNRTNTSPSRS